MQKKLTITVSEDVYNGLHARIGRGHISGFIDNLARPHVVDDALYAAYAEMSTDEAREQAALEWSEALLGDIES